MIEPMRQISPTRRLLPFFLTALALLLAAPREEAQRTAREPAYPESPVLAMPGPMGIQRGTALELTFSGDHLAEPTGLWTSFPARVTIPGDRGNGSHEKSLRIRLEVPRDAPIGFHGIRLATTRGMSNLRLFCVDDLAQVVAPGSNRSAMTALPLPIPCVAAGRIDPETADYYRVRVGAGQRLTFEILGRRLGSELDPEITLYDARGGRELTGGYSNDTPGLQSDPRLTYSFRRAGDYVVEVRDTRWAGGPDFWYRLRVGDFPCATGPVPMAARRGRQVEIGFAGPLVQDVRPVLVAVPTDPAVQALWVAPRGANGLAGWPVALAVSDVDESIEQEPNDTPSRANRLNVPGGATGQFQHRGDVDWFVFRGRRGQKYRIDAQSHEFFSPADVRLAVTDATGAELAQSDPQLSSPADQRVEFTAAANGDYYLSVEHLLGAGGPSEVYHLNVRLNSPGFELDLATDRCNLPAGGYAVVEVKARRHGYAGSVELTVAGTPGVGGKGLVPAGAEVGYMFLAGAPNLAHGPCSLAISGRASDGAAPPRLASVRAEVRQQLAGLSYPPPTLVGQLVAAVTSEPPFRLRTLIEQPESLRGGRTRLRVEAERAPGFNAAIMLSGLGFPPGVSAVLGEIAVGGREAHADLQLDAQTPLGRLPFSICGTAINRGRADAIAARPAELHVVRAFDLAVEPPELMLGPGSRQRIRVIARRHGGYLGPIRLSVRGLPPGVSTVGATIPDGKESVELELDAIPQAVASRQAGVQVVGTVREPAGQGNTSPNFIVRVGR